MLRMEIALFLVLGFVAYIYFSAERKHTPLHRTFSVLLVVVLIHLVFDGLTIYTVNNLDTVPRLLNDVLHRIFVGSMVLVMYLFYQYIAILVEEETGKPRTLDLAARIFLAAALIGAAAVPIIYTVTPAGNYSDGPFTAVCYASATFYLMLCAGLLIANWKQIERKKKFAIGAALLIELSVSALQGLNHTWLISGMGITLMTMAFYLTLENPDILRAELTEQKMSMLYLKSQVNPHFLYNTLDTIRIQAQLNNDKPVADLLMRLVDFFRLSVKVDRQTVALDDELELLEAYMELMCYRYPELRCEYDIDPELGEVQVPNFILQPIVENAFTHAFSGGQEDCSLWISAADRGDCVEIVIRDNGCGFDPNAPKRASASDGLPHSGLGVANVHERLRLAFEPEAGVRIESQPGVGTVATVTIPKQQTQGGTLVYDSSDR